MGGREETEETAGPNEENSTRARSEITRKNRGTLEELAKLLFFAKTTKLKQSIVCSKFPHFAKAFYTKACVQKKRRTSDSGSLQIRIITIVV